ncbi:Holliday junction branch migration protein RuvA [Ravibacter arvi]|uniref:Holliday junction branch migration complex subunit RuvA n=1 Tax=Ravibacter arvi TaxID=2051041 RepID=A0ABP8LRS2_9BACT
MISYISGKLAHKEASFAVIEANGVGYELKISLQTYAALPEEGAVCRLFTFLNIREDAHILYGFWESSEKSLFLHLISVSGVGPAMALIMLSSMSAPEIRGAIIQENIRVIQGIKGIGAKTAQRLVLELKDRMLKDGGDSDIAAAYSGAGGSRRAEALAALVTLGVARAVAEKSLDAILKKYGENVSVEELIKLSLR